MTGTIRTAFATDLDIEAAIGRCRSQLSGPADLTLAFVGGKHDPHAALAAFRAAFGDTPLAGGSAAGAIAGGGVGAHASGFGYSGLEIGMIAFRGPDVTPRIVTNRDLLADEEAAGRALGDAVRAHAAPGSAVLILFDSVATSSPLRLHPASRIMAGFHAAIGGLALHVIGGGLLTDINLSDGWMFDGHSIAKHAMTALVFPPGLRASTAILHGCRPVSSFFEITRVEGAEVLELDGEPALTVIERTLGLELGTTSGQQLSLVATLGQKQGDQFAPFDENNYVNRLILQATPARGSITLFEPDFTAGTRVQIMSRDNALMLDSVTHGVNQLRASVAGADCALALYIDCAGRASVMTGAETEEADLVLRQMTPTFPFMGFYSGVEIAPFAGDYSRPLDWTGVLTVFQRTT
jgi:small ligand-binding sensory domain FIST